jgi:4-amino-4-deoxy-L-arabinose transferase-like glycosyltransferase
MKLLTRERVAGSIPLQCLLLTVALICLLVLTHDGFDTSEGVYHYEVAHQIARYGEFGIPHHMEGMLWAAPNGRTYTVHEFGNALFLVPVAFLNSQIEIHLTRLLGQARVAMITGFLYASMGAVLCTAGMIFLYLNLRLIFGQPARLAVIAVLLCLFCTFYWNYSRLLYDGVLCSVLLSAAALFLFLFVRRDQTWLLLAAFCFLGYGLITRLSMVLPIAAAGVYLLLVLWGRPDRILRAAILGTVTLIPFVLWQLYYNQLRTGNPFTSPVQAPQYAYTNALDNNLWTGVSGLLFSPGKSVFLYCPPALFSILLFRKFWRKYRNEAVFIIVLTGLWLLLHARIRMWSGGPSAWGPRYFVTLVPILAIPFLVERFSLRSRLSRGFTTAFLVLGFALETSSIVGNFFYRMSLAFQNGMQPDTWIWSLRQNQTLDSFVWAARNLKTTFLGGSYAIVHGASAIDITVSNTLNFWWFTAYREGIPVIVLAAATGALVVLAAVCLWALYQAGAAADAHADMDSWRRRSRAV